MPINTKTNYGDIKISDEAIASLVGSTVCECYGIVGVVSKSYADETRNFEVRRRFQKLLWKHKSVLSILLKNLLIWMLKK